MQRSKAAAQNAVLTFKLTSLLWQDALSCHSGSG
jgi:hypothetical protein